MTRTRKKMPPRSNSPTKGVPGSSFQDFKQGTGAQTLSGTTQTNTLAQLPTTNLFGSNITTESRIKPGFRVTYEKDPYNHTNWEYHSITKMPEYQSYSFEQLRWENYLEAKKFEKEDTLKEDSKDHNKENGVQTSLRQSLSTAPSFHLFGGETPSSTVSTTTLTIPNNHVLSLSKDLGILLSFSEQGDTNDLARTTSDIVIKSKDNKKFYAHKLILACRSPKLQKLLFEPITNQSTDNFIITFNEEERKQELTFTDHDATTIQVLLRWIYTGDLATEETQELLKSIYEISHSLGIQLLMEHCLTVIKQHINDTNIAQIWLWVHNQQLYFKTKGNDDSHPVSKLFTTLLLQIEAQFFSALPLLCSNQIKDSSFYTWDEKFVMETFIPTTETWLITNMMNTVLSNSIISLLVKWAKQAFLNAPAEKQRAFLKQLIHFRAMHLPAQWRELLQDLLSSDELMTVDGVTKMFELLP